LKTNVLNWKKRRSMIEGKKILPATFSEAGKELKAAGRFVEAADFFKRAGDKEGLLGLKKCAVEEGNFFLYTLVGNLAESRPEISDLSILANNAKVAGLFTYESKAKALLSEISGVSSSDNHHNSNT
jgi:hypothetical protein